VAPCGVDVTEFTPTGPRAARDSRYRVLSVGRLVPRKGVDLLIQGLALMEPQRRDEVELVIAGTAGGELTGDAEVARLTDLATRLGVADHVTFLGQVPRAEVPKLIRSADVVACTPWYEPFGIVPLESMACGTP